MYSDQAGSLRNFENSRNKNTIKYISINMILFGVCFIFIGSNVDCLIIGMSLLTNGILGCCFLNIRSTILFKAYKTTIFMLPVISLLLIFFRSPLHTWFFSFPGMLLFIAISYYHYKIAKIMFLSSNKLQEDIRYQQRMILLE
jgi:hypothetical protein